MATDVLSVWNMALSFCGNSEEVQAVDENSPNANACRRFYETNLQDMLEDFPWPFLNVTIALAVVVEDPTDEWAFAYAYPSDCLTMGRIQGVLRNETRQSRVPYVIGQYSTGVTVIYTDWANAIAEYTINGTDPTKFSAAFTRALALKLACDIAPRVTGGDPANLMTKIEQRYSKAYEAAKCSALNEEQVEEEPSSEFQRFREYGSLWGDSGARGLDAAKWLDT